MLVLKAANFEDIEQENLFVRDMLPDENGVTNPWAGISREAFEAQALPDMIAYARGERLPEGYVPETFFFLWDDDVIVGQFRVRHHLCDSLREGAGHIGYLIKKEYRGKGYGKAGLRLTLEKARRIIPEDEIYLRVSRENPASLHVMLANGGYIHHETADRYFVRIPK